jgi:hypothetical protein
MFHERVRVERVRGELARQKWDWRDGRDLDWVREEALRCNVLGR